MPRLVLDNNPEFMPVKSLPVGHIARSRGGKILILRTSYGAMVLNGANAYENHTPGWFVQPYTDLGAFTVA